MNNNQKIALALVILTLFIDTLLYSIIIPILPYYSEEMNVSQSRIGLLFSAYAFTMLIFTPLFGYLADRIGRRWLMIFGGVVLALSTGLFLIADTYNELLLARLFQGLGAAATWTIGLAIIADLFNSGQRGKVMGFALSAIAFGTLLGAPIGGFLFDKVGYSMPFIFALALIIIDIVLLFFLLKESKKNLGDKGAFIRFQDLKFIRDKRVLYILCVIVLCEFALMALEPTLPLYLSNKFQASPLEIGLIFAAATLAYGVGSPLVGSLSDHYKRSMLMRSGLIALAIFLPSLLIAQNIIQLMILMGCIGASISLALTPTLPELSDIVEQHGSDAYAIAYSLVNMFFAFSMLFGPLIGGFITEYGGMYWNIIFFTMLIVIFLILGIPLKKLIKFNIN